MAAWGRLEILVNNTKWGGERIVGLAVDGEVVALSPEGGPPRWRQKRPGGVYAGLSTDGLVLLVALVNVLGWIGLMQIFPQAIDAVDTKRQAAAMIKRPDYAPPLADVSILYGSMIFAFERAQTCIKLCHLGQGQQPGGLPPVQRILDSHEPYNPVNRI